MAPVTPDPQDPRPALTAALRDLVASVGDDPTRLDLQETPARWARAMVELLDGYSQDPLKLLRTFDSDVDQVVIVREVPFVSVCEHHMLPFQGRAGVAYLPSGRIVGLSKIPRMIHALARRLQVQERLTDEIASTLQQGLTPRGVLVVVDAAHTCCELRGARAVGTMMTTSCALGLFRTDSAARAEALTFLGRR